MDEENKEANFTLTIPYVLESHNNTVAKLKVNELDDEYQIVLIVEG